MFGELKYLLLLASVIGGAIINCSKIKRPCVSTSNKSPQTQIAPEFRGFFIGVKPTTNNNGLLPVLSPLFYTSKNRNNLTSCLCCSSRKIQLSVYRSDLAQQRLAHTVTTRLNKAYGILDARTAKREIVRCLNSFSLNKWFRYSTANTPTAC
jgi:hypothetical protein